MTSPATTNDCLDSAHELNKSIVYTISKFRRLFLAAPCHVWSWLLSVLFVYILVLALSCLVYLSLTLDSGFTTSGLFRFGVLCWMFLGRVLWRRLRVLRLFVGILCVRIVVLFGLIETYCGSFAISGGG